MTTKAKTVEQPADERPPQAEIHQFQFQPFAYGNDRLKEYSPHQFGAGFATYLSSYHCHQLPNVCEFMTAWESEETANRFLLIFSFEHRTAAIGIATLAEYQTFMREYMPLFAIMERMFFPEHERPGVSAYEVSPVRMPRW